MKKKAKTTELSCFFLIAHNEVSAFACVLQEVWSCWMELLQYLDVEQNWLNTVQEKVHASDNLPESTEAVNEALEVRLRQKLLGGRNWQNTPDVQPSVSW